MYHKQAFTPPVIKMNIIYSKTNLVLLNRQINGFTCMHKHLPVKTNKAMKYSFNLCIGIFIRRGE